MNEELMANGVEEEVTSDGGAGIREPLLEQHRLKVHHLQSATNMTSQVAIVGANICPIESLDYDYGLVGFFNNLAVENVAGIKFVITSNMMLEQKYFLAFVVFAGFNFVLILFSSLITAWIAPAAAGSGIPEVKAYLNGVDTPGVFAPRPC